MHVIQRNLLALSRNIDLGKMSLREIGRLINIEHPQTVSHHINQLAKKGFLLIDRTNNSIKNLNSTRKDEFTFVNIPIVGRANCGPAQLLAIENIEGHIQVSKSVAKNRKLFAIVAEGNSMNRADINGKSIEEGDYVLVDSEYRSPKHGDYCLFVIDEAATIKRFYKDQNDNNIALIAESTNSYPPIYIHAADSDNFFVNGAIVDVVKKISF